ncbi:MarR family winged helix-turn-helix transcriptional regulator [Streptomyces sp. BV129]|uniref:MarR family winged helix-turn-helix transcriptional regulator n=1 Tax=unclassified Streptomyces TaxID=2593676 RepID=UPI001C2EC9C5|nr:MarR family winged helix-turn-helix transcriptional regulator [Streptomyces sp. BV129]MBV1949069.1 MarR family winged helix-turn-helix transcriptional regulator [Streptomyces sp. BV129]
MAETDNPAEQQERVGHLLRWAVQRWTALWADHVDGPLTLIQFAILRELNNESPLDQQTLGHRTGLDKSTCGYLVDRLCKRGALDAGIDPANRRRKLITLTPEGRDLLEKTSPVAVQVNEKALANLSADERAQLAHLLRRLTEPSPKG